MLRVGFAILGLGLASACGGAKPPAPEAPEPAGAESELGDGPKSETASTGSREVDEEDSSEAPAKLPDECKPTAVDVICVPPKGFVDKLCNDVYPNIALAMFVKGSPWTRGFLTRDTKAWNASGGAASDGMLEFDEEVIVLRHRASPKGGVQISGAGGYDVLRWDGSCVTLATEEMTTRPPPRAKAAYVDWRSIQGSMRKALRTSDEVTSVYRARRKECQGVTMGAVSKKCEKLTKKLSDVIVAHVRGGGSVAVPERMPE